MRAPRLSSKQREVPALRGRAVTATRCLVDDGPHNVDSVYDDESDPNGESHG
jgi:hypothetical protein